MQGINEEIKQIIKVKINPIILYIINILVAEIYFKSINHFILVFIYERNDIKIIYKGNNKPASHFFVTYKTFNLLISSEYL